MLKDFRIDSFVLLCRSAHTRLADYIAGDIASVFPNTTVQNRLIDFVDAWDFEEVYGKRLDFERASSFEPEAEDYLVHITT